MVVTNNVPSAQERGVRKTRKRLILGTVLLLAGIGGGVAYYLHLAAAPARAAGLFQRGQTYLAPGGYAQAVQLFNQALEEEPQLQGVYLQRALAYQGLGQEQLMLQDLERAALENPRDARVFQIRGSIAKAKGDKAKAVEDFNKALAIKEDPNLYFDRASMLAELDRPQEAIADLDKVLFLIRRTPHVLRLRSALKAKIGDQEGSRQDLADAQALEDRNTAMMTK